MTSGSNGKRANPNERKLSRGSRYIGRLSWGEFDFLECVDRTGISACTLHDLSNSLGVDEKSARRTGWHLKMYGLVDHVVHTYGVSNHKSPDKNTWAYSDNHFTLNDLGRLFLDEAYECLDASLECAV
jgi:hypothetical protein